MPEQESPANEETLAMPPSPLPHAETGIGIGTVLGPYRIVGEISSGGQGRVYRAEREKPFPEVVAIKVLHRHADTASILARFRAEMQTLAIMKHPCIARAIDEGTTDSGAAYFVMEFVRGLSITEHCDRHRTSIQQRLELFVRVCEAVDHAHSKRIVHRDLKPSNILVEYAADKSTPKVIDFGVAAALDRPLDPNGTASDDGQTFGTPKYMSPEQVDSSAQEIDRRSDVYTLGLVLYELLVGSHPFVEGDTRSLPNAEFGRRHREVDPTPPSQRLDAMAERTSSREPLEQLLTKRREHLRSLRTSLRSDLDWIVMRCLEKDRERRYATAEDLAQDVRRFLRHEPVSAAPSRAHARAKKLVARHQGMSVLAACLFGALILSLGVAWQQWSARQAMQKQLDEKQHELQSVSDFLYLAKRPDILAPVEELARTKAERYRDQGVSRSIDELTSRVLDINSYGFIARLRANSSNAKDAFELCLSTLDVWLKANPDHPGAPRIRVVYLETTGYLANMILARERGEWQEATDLCRATIERYAGWVAAGEIDVNASSTVKSELTKILQRIESDEVPEAPDD